MRRDKGRNSVYSSKFWEEKVVGEKRRNLKNLLYFGRIFLIRGLMEKKRIKEIKKKETEAWDLRFLLK